MLKYEVYMVNVYLVLCNKILKSEAHIFGAFRGAHFCVKKNDEGEENRIGVVDLFNISLDYFVEL